MDPSLLAYYRLSDAETVVQLVGEYRGRLTLCETATGRKYEVERAPFVADVRSGVVERVTPKWRAVEG